MAKRDPTVFIPLKTEFSLDAVGSRRPLWGSHAIPRVRYRKDATVPTASEFSRDLPDSNLAWDSTG